MANLVILESPFKVHTVKAHLGSGYKVIACNGHVRDLPKSSLGVDIENDFDPHYINIRGKGDLIREIRKEAKAAGKVFLATDPDREGEAIAWHLSVVLGIPVEKTLRVTFNELTKNVVKAGIKSPRRVDMNLVDAQQARRILDRIVGYKISPLLWKNVRSGLSAGRVQSVVTKLLVEREEEIRAFTPEEYWTVEVTLCTEDGKTFVVHYRGDAVDGGETRVRLTEEAQAMKVASDARSNEFVVRSVKTSTRTKMPAPPFTTSTLQQEASRRLGFQSQRTMRVAQELYEGINLGSENGGVQGVITYMRTDSQRISAEAQAAARALIEQKYGEDYIPETPRQFKTRAGAQDAHEAIRPARVELEPQMIRKSLTPDQYKLYKLIWERFVSSQMQSATLSALQVDFTCGQHVFRAGGYTVTFPGYMALYEEMVDEHVNRRDADVQEERDARIPVLSEGMVLHSADVAPQQHFTEPPARYNEASLVKLMEEKGIGRPSTYATVITTIISRNYVNREGKMLVPSQLGEITTQMMKEHFPDIVDSGFTADMENELDDIENGERTLHQVLTEFWSPFEKELLDAEKTLGAQSLELPVEETDQICEKCGSRMIVKNGRFGKFIACPNYPKCRNTKPLDTTKPADQADAGQTEEADKKPTNGTVVPDMKCELCGADMVLRTGRYGGFYACSCYPACKFTKQKTKEVGVDCPNCGKPLITRHGRSRTFYGCSGYPECNFSSWDLPTNEKCPTCGGMLFVRKNKGLLICVKEGCNYSRKAPQATEQVSENTEDV
ncbi:MAG: type I DNA topoisomerase [Clostridia bacterium]|nr:type I DNA topoisomerase [Clostridia bacterium]